MEICRESDDIFVVRLPVIYITIFLEVCLRLRTTLPPSCADCLEILKLQPAGTPRACPSL
jgi:hypothetical protein